MEYIVDNKTLYFYTNVSICIFLEEIALYNWMLGIMVLSISNMKIYNTLERHLVILVYVYIFIKKKWAVEEAGVKLVKVCNKFSTISRLYLIMEVAIIVRYLLYLDMRKAQHSELEIYKKSLEKEKWEISRRERLWRSAIHCQQQYKYAVPSSH